VETDSFYHLVKRSFTILQHALAPEPTERFFLEGARYVLAHPEFARDPEKFVEIFRQFDAREALVHCLRQDIAPDAIRIRIGREIPLDGLDDCSYITSPFTIGGQAVGGLGVIGPKRMDYQRISALVGAAARLTTQLLARWEVL
jgi:heat-inducible transcriptional repressor